MYAIWLDFPGDSALVENIETLLGGQILEDTFCWKLSSNYLLLLEMQRKQGVALICPYAKLESNQVT